MYKILTKACELVKTGKSRWDVVFVEKQHEFYTASSNRAAQIFAASSHDLITRCEKQQIGSKGKVPREISLSVSEFAHLMAILTEKEEACSAFIFSGLQVTRAQQQRCESQDEFWDSIVSTIFNDSWQKMGMIFRCLVENSTGLTKIYVNCSPPCVRSGM